MIERVMKLLSLSSSENDHEALAAIRSAHALLKKNGRQWKDFISPKEYKIKMFNKLCHGVMKGTKNKKIHQQVWNVCDRVKSNKIISKQDLSTIKSLYDMVVNKKKSETGSEPVEK